VSAAIIERLLPLEVNLLARLKYQFWRAWGRWQSASTHPLMGTQFTQKADTILGLQLEPVNMT
jgi:hypothetical protein